MSGYRPPVSANDQVFAVGPAVAASRSRCRSPSLTFQTPSPVTTPQVHRATARPRCESVDLGTNPDPGIAKAPEPVRFGGLCGSSGRPISQSGTTVGQLVEVVATLALGD